MRWIAALLLISPAFAQMRTIQSVRGGVSVSFSAPVNRSVACVTSAEGNTELVDGAGTKFIRLEEHQFFLGKMEGQTVILKTADSLPIVTVCQEVEPSSSILPVVLRDMHRLLQTLYHEYIEKGRK